MDVIWHEDYFILTQFNVAGWFMTLNGSECLQGAFSFMDEQGLSQWEKILHITSMRRLKITSIHVWTLNQYEYTYPRFYIVLNIYTEVDIYPVYNIVSTLCHLNTFEHIYDTVGILSLQGVLMLIKFCSIWAIFLELFLTTNGTTYDHFRHNLACSNSTLLPWHQGPISQIFFDLITKI